MVQNRKYAGIALGAVVALLVLVSGSAAAPRNLGKRQVTERPLLPVVREHQQQRLQDFEERARRRLQREANSRSKDQREVILQIREERRELQARFREERRFLQRSSPPPSTSGPSAFPQIAPLVRDGKHSKRF